MSLEPSQGTDWAGSVPESMWALGGSIGMYIVMIQGKGISCNKHTEDPLVLDSVHSPVDVLMDIRVTLPSRIPSWKRERTWEY